MATPPTFSVGATLTAAQMNAVGLWLVKSQAVGTGVSSVTVTGAFSADYDAYRIIWTGGIGSTGINLGMKLGSAATGYYGFLAYGAYSGLTVYGANDNNNSSFSVIGGGDASMMNCDIDVIDPFITKPTKVKGAFQNATGFGNYVGRLADNTSYTAFTLTPNTGTLTGGTVRVYGIRN
jgi:hypothetical protein